MLKLTDENCLSPTMTQMRANEEELNFFSQYSYHSTVYISMSLTFVSLPSILLKPEIHLTLKENRVCTSKYAFWGILIILS